MKYGLKYSRLGARGLLIDWPSEIDENILEDLLRLKDQLATHFKDQLLDITSAYSSLLLQFREQPDSMKSTVETVESIYHSVQTSNHRQESLWRIPVCYKGEFAADLVPLAGKKGLTVDQLVKWHSTPIYRVYFLGFLPGFLYLGGLDERLITPRKSTPSLNIAKGSVAIGGAQTGIYPSDSPGGWHVIGRTPLNLFDADAKECCFVSAGDSVQFVPIDEARYHELQTIVDKGTYVPEPEVP